MRRVAAQHADWLNLVEPTGAFLTLPVLRRVFAQGLDVTPPGSRAAVREALDGLGSDNAARTGWLRFLLDDLLELGPYLVEGAAIPHTLTHTVAEYGVSLRPDLVLLAPVTASNPTLLPRLLVCRWPLHTALDRRPGADAHGRPDRWAASPIERAATLCRATGVRLALVTDTDRCVVVWAPRTAATGSATWVSSLFAEERPLLDAFVSLLGARRFFAVGSDDTLEALFVESASAQAEVTNQLGRQVRAAVELLVGAISRADHASDGMLLKGVPDAESEVYSAVVSVMMRLVFLLSAEERRLFPVDDGFFLDSYAVMSLREQLGAEANRDGDEALERRFSAWHRLLATFRAVYGGIQHERLRLPAYGGGLFDPDRYPFLEGRRADEPWRTSTASPLPIDDRTMLAVLDALQVLTFREGGVTEARRVSYRSLDIEQIGHVYEGLLDHGCVRARDVVLGLVGKKGEEPEALLSDIERAHAKGDAALVAWLVDKTGRTINQLSRLLAIAPDALLQAHLRSACDNDDQIYQRVLPFAAVLRSDLHGLPTVFLPGALFVTQTSDRRDSGTQYTTKDLADEVVRYALEPIVYAPGPAESADAATWRLKSASDLLKLKVCDPAVGSGAILVAACRYLAERLVEAWAAETANGATPAGLPGPVPDEDLELLARRVITDHCLFGVDRNPMAAEMAKLSLWLTTMARERPFTFLDHAIHAGDSLLGITSLAQIEQFHIDPQHGRELFRDSIFDPVHVIRPRAELALEAAHELGEITVLTLRNAAEKARRHAEMTAMLADLQVVADLVAGAALSMAGKGAKALDERLQSVSAELHAAFDERRPLHERERRLAALADTSGYWLDERRPENAPERVPLHWPLAFPEVFLDPARRTGFDAMVGNPPFLGGKRISGRMGTDYREYLVEHVSGGRKGNADLVAYFYLRAAQVSSGLGMLATNTIAQGDTREVGLDWLLGECRWTVHRGFKSRPWPGEASLEVAQLWMRQRIWSGARFLDDNQVAGITSSLDPLGRVHGNPSALIANVGRAFNGSYVLGMGFVLEPDEAVSLIARDPRNAAVVFPYLNGEDLNDSPRQKASRMVLNFFDWSADDASSYSDCWDIIETRVRPERQRRADTGTFVLRRPLPDRYWIYADKRPALYAAIAGMRRVLAITLVSNLVQPAFVATRQVFAHKLAIFAYSDNFHFGLLSSSFHRFWAIHWGSTLQAGVNYSPSDVFVTFPQPPFSATVEVVGKALDEHRAPLMVANNEGLTKTYNRVHNPAEQSAAIMQLRTFHRELDVVVAAAYGWDDIALDHGFHETSQGVRYTIGPVARTEVLDRLLELNHQRYAEEVAAGLHDRTKAKTVAAGRAKKQAQPQDMFAAVEADA